MEINLYEILKGHVGEIFYSPCYGDVKLTEVNERYIGLTSTNNGKYIIKSSGKVDDGGEPMLYPSKALRESFTFEGAWQKMAREKKYKDIVKELRESGGYAPSEFGSVTDRMARRLTACIKLMNVQKWIEKGWQPDSFKEYWYIFINVDTNQIELEESGNICGDIYFSTIDNAQKAIDILGEDTIRKALSTDW